jgi:hypothetical protein
MNRHWLLGAALVLVAAPAFAQSDRAYERANDHARFKRTTATESAPISVPEPSTALLLAGGVAAVAAWRGFRLKGR